MKNKILVFLSVLFLGLTNQMMWGQTNPAPHDLSSSNFTFTGFSVGTTTTYPTSMQGWKFSSEPVSSTVGPANGDRVLENNNANAGSGNIKNEVSNGLSILNSSSNHIGAIVVAINTEDRQDIKVSWSVEDITSGNTRQNGIRLQYRIGTSGNFTEVSSTTYLSNAIGTKAKATFTEIELPEVAEDKEIIQVRWIYYFNNGSDSRDRLRLDDITISSSAAGPPCSASTPNGAISGTTPACVSTTLTYTHGSGQPEDGITYYWQTSPTGESTDNNASSTLNVTTSGSYYVRAYDSVEDCWSVATSGYSVEVNTFVAPLIDTNTVTTFNHNSATLRAQNITYGKCPDTTAKGFVYAVASENATPTLSNGGTDVPISLNPQNATFTSSVTGLAEGTTYAYQAYLYDGTTYTYGGVQTFTTTFSESLNNVTSTKACMTDNGATITWTAPATGATPTGYMVFAVTGEIAPSGAMLTELTDYSNADSNFSATTNNASPATLGKLLYKGASTSLEVTGLTEDDTYSFLVLAYQDGGSVRRFSGGSAGARALGVIANDDVKTLTGNPVNQQVTLNWTYNGNTGVTSCFDEVIIVANQGTVSFTPTGDGSAYTANSVYATANQVIYKGTGNTVAVTGLANQTEYCFRIFIRRGTVWSDGTEVCAVPTVTYCNSTGASNNSGILNVSFNTINQSSASTSGYTNYTDVNTTLVLGHSYDLEVVVNTNGNYTSYVKVWIDWNINGTFDSSEAYELGSVTNDSSGIPSLSPYVINVPANATPGSLRMRVAANTDNNLNGYSTPCQSFTYGEVEDYTIVVIQPTDAEINIKGNNISIPDGFDQPYGLNNTLFGQTDLGDETASKEFIIENIGATTLNLTGSPLVEITGINPNDFIVTQQPASNTVAPGSSVIFQIKFAPTSTGTRTATVFIANNDSDENPYRFDIQGTGVCSYTPVIAANPDTGPVGTVVSFTSATEDLTGAIATYNGVSVIPVLVTSSQVDVQIPLGANDGNLVLHLANGCTYVHTFNLIDTAVTDCDNEGGGGSLAPNLTFFEFYDRKDGSYGYVSIYNGTGIDVNLSGYAIHRAPDYGGSYSTYANLSGTLPAGEIAIIGVNAEGSTCPYVSTGNGSFGGGFNANDGLRLVQGSTIIDDFHAPNYTGYYVKRKTEYLLSPNTTYSAVEWTIQALATGACLEDVAVLPVIKTPPSILSETFNYTTCDSASLEVTASEGVIGGAGLTYQWYMNNGTDNIWTALTNTDVYNGVTTANLTITSLSSLEEYQYYVRVMEGGADCYVASSARQIKESDFTTTWNGSWTNGTPDATKKVVINGVYNTDTNGGFEACACEVTSSGNLTIEEGGAIIIHNQLSNSGTVLVKNNANLIQINDLAVNSGDITVERITRPMNTYSFTYWGSPVETDLSDINWYSESAPGVFDVPENTNVTTSFAWNAVANSWYFTPYTGTMNTAYGYIIKAPNSFTVVGGKKPVKATFNGVPNNGNSTVDIVPNNDNLLSNPYPSAIDIDKFLTEYGGTAVIPTIYLWTHASTPTPTENGSFDYADSDFATYTMLGGTSTNYPEELKPAGKVASGQGFFIKGTTSGGTVEFKNSYRYDENMLGYDNNLFFKVMNNETENENTIFEKHRLWLNITGENSVFKQTLIGYSNLASDQLDMLDGLYYDGGNPTNFYTVLANEKYSIQAFALPFEVTDVIPLGYTIAEAGNYTIVLDDFDGLFENQDIFIKDNLLETIHNLKEEPYVFISSSGTFHDRFEVVFQSDGGLSVNNPHLNDNWVVYTKGNQLHLQSLGFQMRDIYVYDMLGREIYKEQDFNSNKHSLDLLKSDQVLIIKMISTDNQVFVRKTMY